jgi:hypothetical protein
MGGPLVGPRPDDDLYAKVIEIAQEQAQASSAQTELHRQNVTKLDTMTTLLSAQTTTVVGIGTAINHMNEALQRSELAASTARDKAVEDLKGHIAREFKAHFEALEFWRKPAFWLAIALLALSNLADVLPKVVGLFKP